MRTTTTTIARGSRYSTMEIYDPCSYGEVTVEEAEILGDEIVAQFEQRANARLPYAQLIYGTSEVYGYAYAEYPDNTEEILADCLDEANVYVMEHMDELLGEDD